MTEPELVTLMSFLLGGLLTGIVARWFDTATRHIERG